MKLRPANRFPTRKMALEIASAYALLGGLWILCSGWLLHRMVQDPQRAIMLENVKGWLFVLVTALILGFALDRYFRLIRSSAQMLEKSEARLRQAAAAGNVGFWDWNLRTNQVFYSAELRSLLGYSGSEIADDYLEWETRLHPDDREPTLEHIRNLLANPASRMDAEFRMRHRDGSYRWILSQASIIADEHGKPLRMLGSNIDITQRKEAEEALRQRMELQDQLAKVGASVPGAVLSFRQRPDGSACIPFSTAAIEDLLGVSQQLLAEDAAHAFKNIHPDDIAHARETLEKARQTPSRWHDAYRYHHPTKGLRWIEGSAMPRVEPDGSVVWHGFLSDSTERRQLEEDRASAEAQLRQAQKMEALGTLAGGIAHDFNNILAAILGYSEMALAELDDPAQAKQDIQEVLKGAERARDLVQQILAFSRRGESEKKPVQAALIAKEALKMIRASLPSTIEIKQNISSKAAVMADPTHIHQVLMNLCTNAAHAMRETGGILEVRLEGVTFDPLSPPPTRALHHGSYLKLTVADTGHGIEPSILDRIFDPFFTTKKPGLGTGLGLSVVHGIVKNCGGDTIVESVPGKGTAFHVYLPAVEPTQEQPAHATSPLPRGCERILVVDDEPALAKATARQLSSLGYSVEFQMNGMEALEAIRTQPAEDPFKLVITDMTMPHLTGVELAQRLHATNPEIAIILCTGFSETLDPQNIDTYGIQALLMKPFELKDLAAKIRDLLDAPAPAAESTAGASQAEAL